MKPFDAVVRSLNFQADRRELLLGIPQSAWPDLLNQTDRLQLTLPLAVRCVEFVPASVRLRLERNLADNAIRHEAITERYGEVAAALAARGTEFLVLKGLSHSVPYCAEASHRPQYDIDFYCHPASIESACETLNELGYRSIGPRGRASQDHLPAMVREGFGAWCGDYYAVDLPLPVELHFRFWHPEWERFEVHGAERFRERAVLQNLGGLAVPCLHPVDRLTYACWHALKHHFRGALKTWHVYELAHFLHHSCDDSALWAQWREFGAPEFRLPETIALRLATEWFGCRLSPVLQQYFDALPPAIARWFELYGSHSSERGRRHKDELFLHLCLVRNRSDRWKVTLRRAFPKPLAAARMAGPAGSVSVPLGRVAHHGRALLSLLKSGLRWWRAADGNPLFE